MKYEKSFIAIGLVALLLAVPMAQVMKIRTNQLKIERANSTKLELRIDSVQHQLDQKEQQLKQEQQDKAKLQSDKAELEKKLQSKRNQAASVAAVTPRQVQTGDIAPSVAFQPASGSCAALRPLVAQYGWPVNTAMAVMQAESGCRPGAENPTDYHVICYGSRGLFQIGCDSTGNYAGMFDAGANIAHAYSMWSRRGWQPWGAYTSGAYLKYLQ